LSPGTAPHLLASRNGVPETSPRKNNIMLIEHNDSSLDSKSPSGTVPADSGPQQAEAFGAVSREIDPGAVGEPSVYQDDDGPFLFRLDGDGWHLCYTEGATVERNSFPRKGWKGFAYLQHLIGRPEKQVPALELSQVIPHQTRREDITKFKLLSKEYSENEDGEPEDAGPLGSVLGEMGFTRQTKCDRQTVRDIKESLSEERQLLEEAESNGDRARIDEQNRRIGILLEYLRDVVSANGGTRAFLDNAPHERARKRIGAAIRDARERLEETMPRLARHLHQSIAGESGGFIYRPPNPAPRWAL
jgi:hypothetical protein